MALHYIHMSNGHTTLDDRGTEHPDLSSAQADAVRAASELLNLGTADSLWLGTPWKVWITDRPNGDGRTLAAIEISGTCRS